MAAAEADREAHLAAAHRGSGTFSAVPSTLMGVSGNLQPKKPGDKVGQCCRGGKVPAGAVTRGRAGGTPAFLGQQGNKVSQMSHRQPLVTSLSDTPHIPCSYFCICYVNLHNKWLTDQPGVS